MPVVIENGAGRGVYNSTNLRTLLDTVAIVINRDYANIGVKKGPLPFVHSPDYYRFASLDALAQYMLEVNADRVVQYHCVPPVANLPLPNFVFGDGHGDLHFNGDPTDDKSKWSLLKAAAKLLMEAEITKHLPRMRRESRIAGWEPWYVGGQANANIGRYYIQGQRGGGQTNMFTIQAQVNWLENEINYHGFPDQRLLRTGLGKARNTIV